MPSTPLPPEKEQQPAGTEHSAKQKRIAGLRQYSSLETPPDAALDRITRLAARLFAVPLAAVSLVGNDRVWFQSGAGLCRSRLPAEVPRENSPCAAAVLAEDVLVVEDARLDPRFAGHLLVTGFDVRFYAGAPLILEDGTVAGTLCVMDFEPRLFPPDQQAALKDMAANVVSEIELRRAQAVSKETEQRHRQMFAESPQPMWVFDAETLQFLDVMHYSLEIAAALGLDGETRRVIEIAALLHDVGKIGVPDAILRKPSRLSEDDYEAIKQHPLMGSVIVGAVPGFEETLNAVRHHHERWDGGYPFGLRGEETPLMARLMAVADAYSAMTTDRPYRKGMDVKKALDILENGTGTQWDPVCVRAFLRVRRAVRQSAEPERVFA